MVSDVVRKHLMAARQELLQQRNAIDADLIEIDRILGPDSKAKTIEIEDAPDAGGAERLTEPDVQLGSEISVEDPLPRGSWAPSQLVRASDVPRAKVSELVGAGTSIEEAVLSVLDLTHAPMKTEDIVTLVIEASHEWERSSIRSQLARSYKDGKVRRLKRGVYVALGDDSTPDEAGVESLTEVPLVLEGGVPDRDQYPHQEDHRDDQA